MFLSNCEVVLKYSLNTLKYILILFNHLLKYSLNVCNLLALGSKAHSFSLNEYIIICSHSEKC